MSKTQVGSCPKCGAPIYVPTAWFGITNPPNEYTCNCVEQPKTVVSTSTIAPSNTLPEEPIEIRELKGGYRVAFWKEGNISLWHKDGRTWSDRVRMLSHLTNELQQAQTTLLQSLISEVEELIKESFKREKMNVPNIRLAEGFYRDSCNDILALLRKRLNNE